MEGLRAILPAALARAGSESSISPMGQQVKCCTNEPPPLVAVIVPNLGKDKHATPVFTPG